MSEPQPPPQQQGFWQAVVNVISGMTITQAVVVLILLVALVPSYLLYRVINDPELAGRFLSSYEEVSFPDTSCILRIASLRGGGDEFAISTAFAAQGGDRYVISVLRDRKPSEVEIQSYCATLTAIVDHLRSPETTPSPSVIWHYPAEKSP